ncbi:MBL fold metallo-hydrolase [Chitinophaga sedimenti]|uniref:MBL fold metallo-hydrolase n=1 Tax=Chitinophaga sedimenti TaxID=2033606 RepID=UPI0020032A2E|nr:MBL fold metallo-hydrolase [Chitinophaga sedimenti]MCK7557211.1 MBL fold metallo-hydrolase [Chitinophaga sedimenti]
MDIHITHIDTACLLLEIGDFRILTDPTLDRGGRLYHHGYGAVSRKTDDPALPVAGLPEIDLVLLSHHQHKDNFDNAGKAFTINVPQVLSTRKACGVLDNIAGLAVWETFPVLTNKVRGLRITATPAQHHPWWLPEFVSGPVIGFVIEYEGQENGVIYISGDTVYFAGIDEIARRYKVDIGIMHAGGVQFPYLTGFGKYTMDSKDLLKAASIIRPNKLIPVHQRGWTHFKEREDKLKKAIDNDTFASERCIYLRPGRRTFI